MPLTTNKKIAMSDIMPGYTASHSVCKKTTNLRAKFYGKTEWRNTCEQITELYQSYVISDGHDVYSTKVLKLRVRL